MTCLQAILELQAYAKRLGILFIGSFALLGGPIAYQTFDPFKQVCILHEHASRFQLHALHVS